MLRSAPARLGSTALLALSACLATSCASSMMQVPRKQPVLITLQAGAPSVGILGVEEDAPLANNTPAGDVRSAVVAAIGDYFKENGGGHVGDHPNAAGDSKLELKDVRDLSTDLFPALNHFPASLPPEVNEALVTFVRVNTWRVEEAQGPAKNTIKKASLLITFSTHTREGTLVLAERVQAEGRQQGAGPVDVSLYPDPASRARDFKVEHAKVGQPSDVTELFAATVRAAAGLHYYPFFAHAMVESFFLDGDGPNEGGLAKAKAGQWKEAQAAWLKVAAADPKNAGALYDAGVAALTLGDEEQALDLVTKACALDDKTTWEWTLKPLKARVAFRKTVQ